MSIILGRLSFDGKPVDKQRFGRAFETVRPARVVRSDWVVTDAAGFGHHDSGLGTAAPQPVTQGHLTLVADACLYNREELSRLLECRPDNHSDAELILRAYLYWGTDCLQHMNGDFGIAIYDAAKRALFLARDHIGARPLFWTQRGSEVLFTTLLSGLTAFDDLQWPLSERRIARYLCDPHDVRLDSFLDGVEAVGPGHWLRISGGQVTRQCWWNPDAIKMRNDITMDTALEQMRAITETAIRARLPCNVKIGSHCSGGMDSTLVTVMASKALKERGSNLAGAYTWSPPFDERYPDIGESDERRVIASECAELGVPVRYGQATAETFEELVAQPMELQGTADLMDELPTIKQAQADGIGVMLSGWGGDEAFSSHGTGHVAWLLRHGRFRSVLSLSRRCAGGLRRPDRMSGFLWRAGIVPMLPGWIYRYFQPFADIYGGGAFPSAQFKALCQAAGPATGTRLRSDADAYMREMLKLGHVAERMATWAAWSAPAEFEYRYPLVDRELLEFMLSLPPEIRFGDGSSRYLARRALRIHLPKGVNKKDRVNEKLRQANRQGWWSILSKDAQQGRLDNLCPWLEMSKLKLVVSMKPPPKKNAHLFTFAKMFVALRVYSMYRRHFV